MERSRPVHAITHTILAWNTRKSSCKQHGGFSYETFQHSANTSSVRDFLSPEEEDTLFLNDLEEELAFSSVTSIFSRCKLVKIADFFELKVSRDHLDGFRCHFWMTSATFELLANFLAPSKQMHLVGLPFNKENKKPCSQEFDHSLLSFRAGPRELHEHGQFGQNQFSQFSELARFIYGRTSPAGQF